MSSLYRDVVDERLPLARRRQRLGSINRFLSAAIKLLALVAAFWLGREL